MARAIDVVQVKAEIAAEKLAVIIENGSVLLKDMQSGEAVKIATLTLPNEPLICDGCLWAEMGALEKCSSCMRDKKDNYLGTVEVVQDMQFAKEHFTSI